MALTLFGLVTLVALWNPGSAKRVNSIELSMSTTDEALIYGRKNKKVKTAIKGISGILPNGDRFDRAKIHTRGDSDSESETRKSFNLTFDEPQVVFAGSSAVKKIAVLGLAEDKYLFRNLLGYRVFTRFGLFQSRFQTARLAINGSPRGMALLVEPPELALARSAPDVEGIIRLVDDGFALIDTKNSRNEALARNTYQSLEKILGADTHEPITPRLSRLMDVNRYLELLAVNRILRNGDYSDEILMGAVSEKGAGYFRHYSQWDLEETLAEKPHHGSSITYLGGKTSLVYSGESRLDRTIAHDCALYARYLEILSETLEVFSPEFIREVKAGVDFDLSLLKNIEVRNYYRIDITEFESERLRGFSSLSDEIRTIHEKISNHRKMIGRQCGKSSRL